MAEEQMKYPIEVPVATNADEAADSVESLRDAITAGTADIRAMVGSMKQLRGSTDEIKSAKKQLETRLEAVRNKVSASTLALVKQGTTYDAAVARSKKFAEEQKKLAEQLKKDDLAKQKDRADAMGNAIKAAGGPVSALKDRLGALKDILGESSGGMGVMTLAAAGLVAAVAAVTAGVVAGAVALGKFVLGATNAARALQLDREAWSGTAENAKNLGTQIDALASKIPTPKARLNELATTLMGMRIPGGATVDILNAVGQASAALGDEAGGKIKDFLTRARQIGRVQINPQDMLEGFGNLDFTDVAKHLAKGMGISIEEARKALVQGRVKTGDAAKAMREAIEEKFGGLNLRKMLTFENMTEKFHEKLSALTSGIDLEPLLKPLGELGKLFDESTVTGKTLKFLITQFGKGMVDLFVRALPLAKGFFQGAVIGALQLYIKFLQLRKSWRETFGTSSTKDVDAVRTALRYGKAAAELAAVAFVALGAAVTIAAAPFVWIGKKILDVVTGLEDLEASIGPTIVKFNKSAQDMGKAVIEGLVGGIKEGAALVEQTVGDLGDKIKTGFKNALGIHSPSKVFAEFGRNTAEGYQQGVSQGAPAAQQATTDLATPPAPGGGGPRGGGAPVLHVHINVGGGGHGEQTAKALSSPSFLAQLTKVLEDLLAQAGNPVQT